MREKKRYSQDPDLDKYLTQSLQNFGLKLDTDRLIVDGQDMKKTKKNNDVNRHILMIGTEHNLSSRRKIVVNTNSHQCQKIKILQSSGTSLDIVTALYRP